MAIFFLLSSEKFLPISFKMCTVITEPARGKKELSEIFLINWQCSNIMQYLNIEKNVEDVWLDFLLIVRKYVYNQYNCNRSFNAADHTHVDVRTCTLYSKVQWFWIFFTFL